MQPTFEEVVDIPFIYVHPVQCKNKTNRMVHDVIWTFCNSNVCWHFVFKFGWLASGQFCFSPPPHTTLSCNCEFFMNSPTGLAFGHNHFLLNPVSGTLFIDIEVFAIMHYGLQSMLYGRVVQLRGFAFEVFKVLCSKFCSRQV